MLRFDLLNWQRGVYLALFFCTAVFASIFRSLGHDALGEFGTFRNCDGEQNASCRGNQMIFRASFCVSAFFFSQALMSQFGSKTRARRCLTYYFIPVELLAYIGLLVGSFFIPSSFFLGYSQVARVLSGLFILFQIVSIIGVSYEARDFLLDRIASAEEAVASSRAAKPPVWGSPTAWKLTFLGCCLCTLLTMAVGLAYLFANYGGCTTGVAFATITTVVAAILISVCVAEWMDVGLLPPCVVSAYLVLMCWQALTSSPHGACQSRSDEEGITPASDNAGSVVVNAVIASFAITWTSWRSSSAASSMFARGPGLKQHQPGPSKPFAGVVVLDVLDPVAAASTAATAGSSASRADESRIQRETPQFHCMMLLAGLYMAMVLTDWDSANGVSNGTSMWVKIVAQWLTMLFFAWTLAAPKLFPDRDFSG